MKSIRSVSGAAVAVLAMAGMAWFPDMVHAQASMGGEFKLSQEVHWGDAVLPTGSYTYSIDSGSGSTVVRVRQIGGALAGLFVPQTSSEGSDSGIRGIVLQRVGEEAFVTSLHVARRGTVLNFMAPIPKARIHSASATQTQRITVSNAPTEEFFTIFNPENKEVSFAEAERIYLAACEAVEREFNRSTPIRPRLVLHLGGGQNVVRYPTLEIRLAKWDKYRFAEGVVELALRDLMSPEDRQKLSEVAVNDSGATVSVCELKDCKDKDLG